MFKKIIIFIFIFLMFSGSAFSKNPIKIAVLPWSFNLYIEEAVKQSLLKEDNNLFPSVMLEVEKTIEENDYAISSFKFGNTEEAAKKNFFPDGYLSVPVPNKREVYDADLLIFIRSPEKDAEKYTELVIVSVETGREVTTLIEDAKITNANFASLIAEYEE